MNLQNRLFIIYTIIFIVILITTYVSLFGIKKIKEFTIQTFLKRNILFNIIAILLFLFILIICTCGIFISFILCNGLAKIFVEDGQFFQLQLYTNIPNYFVIYYYFLVIKEKSKQ